MVKCENLYDASRLLDYVIVFFLLEWRHLRMYNISSLIP